MLLPIKSVEKLDAEISKLVSESNLKDSQAEKVDEEVENMEQDADLDEVKVLDQLTQTQNQARQLDLMDDKNQLTSRGLDIQEKAIAKGVKK